ncbi:MAG: ATP-dependent Clp protease ATP-binding subunit ClpX [Puniceicoccales bacterium]|nr:ATP-dependent Clp protease ATP-binding subunit ClpX [Puniceicoccales bacterium]
MAQTNMAKAPPQPSCSFCGRPGNLVGRIIAGPNGANICNECVATCNHLLAEAGVDGAHPPAKNAQEESEPAAAPSGKMTLVAPPSGTPELIKLIPPSEIHAALDEFVIGQEQAKKVLSVAVYNHYKRLNAKLSGQNDTDDKFPDLRDIEVEKSNILLLGPTGSGKTLLARTLARMLDVPFAIADATTVTEAGYVGEDVESIVQRLLAAADFDARRAETGIIYIDEIDKLAIKGDSPHVSRNLGQGVQHALLKIVEGCLCNVPPQGGRKHPEQRYVQVDTANILFICGGAFVGLDEIVGRRVGNKFLGFDVNASRPGGKPLTADEIMEHLQPEDLFNYGLIPEFVGRLPVVSALSELSQTDLERVLLEPKNSLVKQFRKLFAMEGVNLVFTPESVSAVANRALSLKTGARGLRSIIEHLMLDAMYEMPRHRNAREMRVTADMVNGKQRPEFLISKAEKSLSEK